MSTEHQRYSIDNQSAAIHAYAAAHGLEIVRSYRDNGKSGLTLDGRPALKQLINDVQQSAVDFAAVLVFDISRWGRFQDTDESAYYEFICRRTGIAVHYCAEQFENDGTPLSTVIKSLKRAMAGEYSRELSQKVFAGQSRLIRLGFYLGGRTGYGLRRELRDEHGVAKAVLEFGQRKNVQSDRTVLVPGPPDEVEVVRWIFEVFAAGQMGESQIASALNAKGLVTTKGFPWSFDFVNEILKNERYIGVCTWNAHSHKLMAKPTRNPENVVIRIEGAFTPIVDKSLFDSAQEIIRGRRWHRSRDKMLERLRQLHKGKMPVTRTIVCQTMGDNAVERYKREFGSFTLAVEAAGLPAIRENQYVGINRELTAVRARVVASIIAGVRERGGRVASEGRFLQINGEFRVSVFVMRGVPRSNGKFVWSRYLRTDRAADVLVAIRMKPDNMTIHDFCIIPSWEATAEHFVLSQRRDRLVDCYRFDDLQVFFSLTRRSGFRAVP